MRLVFLGSGSFGLPTLKTLVQQHDVALVLTQPDRPARRGKVPTPTPIGEFAAQQKLSIAKPENINEPEIVERIRAAKPQAIVVIAYGQKISRDICNIAPTINLHGSLLPKYRGAAPIHRAMMNNETETGVAIIDVAERMDAGDVYATAATNIRADETAGELHDRLAELGPDLMLNVLEQIQTGTAQPIAQDETLATRAPKLSKEQGTVDFHQPAELVRARIHGLTPWPGCTVQLNGDELKILQVCVRETESKNTRPGELLDEGMVACGQGTLELLTVQPPGKRPMSFAAYSNGRAVKPGLQFTAKQTQHT